MRRIRGPSTENFRTLTTDEYDNVYVLGNYNSSAIYVDSTAAVTNTYTGNSGGYDTYIGKYNRSGVLQWFLRKGSTAKDIYNDFVIRNNLIYATGYFANEIVFNQDTLRTDDPLNEDAFLAAFNEIGDPIAGVSVIGTGNYNDAGTVVNMDNASRAYVSGYYKSQQIQIGDEIYTSDNVNKSDFFFAIYEHPFTAVITDERSVSCNGLSDGMLEVTPYFGKPPYTYDWSHDPGLDGPVAYDLPAGPYSITVTDNNGKIAQISTNVPEPDPIVITETITDVSCYNGDDGAIDITVTGGTVSSDYNYFWTSLDGSGIEPLDQNQSGLTEGNYSLEVRDDNLCTASAVYYVPQADKIIYAGSVVTDISVPPGDNGAVDLIVSGGNDPYEYNWTGPSGYNATTEDISGLGSAGLYYISITDSKDCRSDTSFAVTDNITMIAQVTAKTDVTCYGLNNGTATVTVYNGQEPYTYSWSDGPVIYNAFRSNMAPGKYEVVVTDALSNTALDSVRIFEAFSELILTLNPQDLRCYQDNSGVIDLTVTGGTLPYSFEWSNGYTGEDLVNVASNTYIVQVTDANGCFAQNSAEVDEPPPIALDIDLSGENYCPEDKLVMATADASGGWGSFEYLWDDPGAQVTETAYDLGAGNYTVTVTDQNGCKESESVLITAPDPFVTSQIDYVEPTCAGDADGSIIPWITGGTGGYDYVWSNNIFQRINTNITAGTYTLTITDDNNCIFTEQYTLNEPDTVKITSVETTDLTCSGYPDGALEITATGGTGSLYYSIDNGLSYIPEANISALAEGNYNVKVKDDNNCESETHPVTLVKSETCRMVIYDAISPNNDGYNEVWHIGNIDNYPSCTVKIYNTWGTLVFSSEGYGTPWDGTYEGKELPSATYYYVIDPGDGSEILTGAVSIVK
ncbi:MAG: gliding motility-associated C-terminal domain-containing protein [Bacteroidales bacterium]|nr:gliding motility-associated C-terminal domain-containing protein [Bacteroidales bacterium]